MSKFISFLVLFVTILGCRFAYAQDNLNFEFDYARFKYDSTSVFMEFYYSFDQRGLLPVKTDQGFLIEAILHLEMKNIDTEEDYINRDWKVQNILPDTSIASMNQNLVGKVAYVIPKGNYNLVAEGKDINNQVSTKKINETVIVQPFSIDKIAMSDIQLSTNIIRDGANPNSLFYKNTLEIFPNPAMLYGESSPVLFYYSELYNLLKNSESKSFKLQKVLYNSRGYTVYETSRPLAANQNSIVDIGLINLSKYPSDTYNLILSVTDESTSNASYSSKRFYLYNPSIVDTFSEKLADVGFLESEYSVMNEEECDDLFKKSHYVLSGDQKSEYEKLTSLEAKRKYLYTFWKSKDINPTTAKNEFKELYIQRINYANENFRHKYKEGYLTDRGRVYILYGTPDNKDFHYSEPNLKPYEIWYYNSIEAGVQFIFGDVTGFSSYELIHSTKRGEVRDDGWQDRLTMVR